MTNFAALRWPPQNETASLAAECIKAVLLGSGWSPRIDRPGWSVLDDLAAGPAGDLAHGVDRPIVVGRLFDRAATEQGAVGTGALPNDGRGFRDLCEHLVARCWGAYVALAADPADPGRLDIFRDPVGMLDCSTWTSGTLRIVTSTPEALIAICPPDDVAIDWARVAATIRFPGAAGEALPLKGIEAVPAGTLLRLRRHDREAVRLWTPTAFCGRSMPPPAPRRSELPELINACVASWAGDRETIIAELSGGLDSAIIASAIARLSRSSVTEWFHYFGTDREGDERVYARAVADHLHLSHTEVAVGASRIDQPFVDAIPVSLRPNVASVSLFHDADLAARGRALGATMLLTGQGGDALFFQPALPSIAADLWDDRRSFRDKMSAFFDLAGWSRQSVWSVAGAALRARLRPARLDVPTYGADLLASDVPRQPIALPWAGDVAGLAPAKQVQLLNLATARATFAGSSCAATMAVVHPLMSQPLLERVLPISALDLTGGGKRDRALIRAAYAERLPARLLERRSKGSASSFYGRMLAASVPFLRSYLHDGVLAGQAMLDRDALDAVLDTDHLMRTNSYTEILILLLIEHWARGCLELIATPRPVTARLVDAPSATV